MRARGLQDHGLHLDPVQVLLSEALLLCLVGLCVLEEQDADEEVEEEETANQYEQNEEPSLVGLALGQRALVGAYDVERLVHDVWPAFQRRDNEKGEHRLPNVVEVRIPDHPLSSCLFARLLAMVEIHVLAAVEEGPLVGADAKDSEHEPDHQDDDCDLEDRSHRSEKGSHDQPQRLVVRDDAQRPQRTQQPQNLDGWDVDTLQGEIDQRSDDDEEIKLTPAVAKIRLSIHYEAERNDLDHGLGKEDPCEERVDLVADTQDYVVLREIVGRHVGVRCQLEGGEENEQHDDSIELLVLLDVEAESSEHVVLVKEID